MPIARLARTSRLPPDVARLLGDRAPRPVTEGESGASVLRYASRSAAAAAPALFLKTFPAPGGGPPGLAIPPAPLTDEAARLRWMAARGVPVPAVRYAGVHDGREYLLLDELPGASAATLAATLAGAGAAAVAGADRDRAGATAERALALVHALADALRRLHATPAGDCPFRHPVADRVAEARARLRAGLVDEDDFDDERRGRSGEALLAELEALRPAAEAAAAGEAPVFTHGDYTLENVIVRDALGGPEVVGVVDCGRAGVADCYQDLALGAGSVASHLGARWVPTFLARYGVGRVDAVRLRFYALLYEFF